MLTKKIVEVLFGADASDFPNPPWLLTQMPYVCVPDERGLASKPQSYHNHQFWEGTIIVDVPIQTHVSNKKGRGMGPHIYIEEVSARPLRRTLPTRMNMCNPFAGSVRPTPSADTSKTIHACECQCRCLCRCPYGHLFMFSLMCMCLRACVPAAHTPPQWLTPPVFVCGCRRCPKHPNSC